MRMTGFIVGGILGMVGAFALMQRKPGVAKVMQGAVSDMQTSLVTSAISKMTNSKSQPQSQATAQPKAQQATAASSTSSHSASAGKSGHSNHQGSTNHVMNVSLIEGIIKNDPELQSTVEEIKKESKSVH